MVTDGTVTYLGVTMGDCEIDYMRRKKVGKTNEEKKYE